MTSHCTVNDTLARLDELSGQPLEVEGVLGSSLDDGLGGRHYWLLHYPKAERAPEGRSLPAPSAGGLWLAFGDGSLRPNATALARWEGKRVRIHGIAWTPRTSAPAGGLDDRAAYHPHLEVYSIQRVTSQQRREDA
jgi:hypothetical protein